jgi:serine protease AprX
MKRLTSKIALVAVIGAAAFVLQTNDRMTPWPLVAFDAPADSTTAVNRDVAGERESRPAAAAPERTETMPANDATMADAVSSFYAEPQTAPRAALAAAARPQAEERTKPTRATALSKMSGGVAALAMAGGDGLTEIIVSYEDYPELFEDGRVESLGGEVVRRYGVLEQLAVRIPADALIDLAVEESVNRLSLDDAVQVTSASSRKASNRPVVPAPNAYFKGQSVGVAVVDTGVALHSDLNNGIRQYSFLGGAYPQPTLDGPEIDAYNSTPRGDGYGHGTHVAGIISGSGKGSSGAHTGPATGAKLLSLQVLDDNGQGQMSDVMAALDWLLQYGSRFDIKVVNLSLGKPVSESYATDPLVLATEQLWDAGMVVVVAAGNHGHSGYFTTTSPGNSRKVITVGSLTDNGTGEDFTDDYVSSFSSRGPTPGDFVVKPDLVAPGNRLISAVPDGSTLASLLPDRIVTCNVSTDCADDYLVMSGTSMAAPVVSATVAMMIEKDPSLTPATIKARLMRSAHKLPGSSPIEVGAGLLDMEAALDDTGTVSGEALSPLMVFDEASGGTLIEDTGLLWGDTVWASGFLWTDGDGVNANGFLWTDGDVDANGFLWTDGTTFANGFLWTDGGGDGRIAANGFLWTDGGGSNAQSMFDPLAENPVVLDDEQPVE